MLQLVSSHDECCDSNKCSSVLCATVSPSQPPHTVPLHHPNSSSPVSLCWLYRRHTGLRPIWWHQFSDARVTVFSHIMRELRNFFCHCDALFPARAWDEMCKDIFSVSSLWKPCSAATFQTWPCTWVLIHLRTTCTHTHTHTRARVPSWHWLKEWFIDWGAAFLNNLQLSAAKVNANLWTAAIMLQSTRVCFTSCEGVRNLRATGTLAHGLFPCCLGNNGAGCKMSILAVLWALSCVESERAVRVCGPWRESDEWCFIPDDYLLCVTQLWVRGPLSCSSEENWEKSTELLWIAKWDMLTAHVIVKYRLMGIIKLEHCLTQSFSWMLHKGEYQCCRVKTFQLQFWTSVEWLYFSICS